MVCCVRLVLSVVYYCLVLFVIGCVLCGLLSMFAGVVVLLMVAGLCCLVFADVRCFGVVLRCALFVVVFFFLVVVRCVFGRC